MSRKSVVAMGGGVFAAHDAGPLELAQAIDESQPWSAVVEELTRRTSISPS